MCCPSSVVRPSVRPSSVVVNFSHFRLLLWNRWTEFDETLQEGRSQRPLPSLCFLGWSEKQDGSPGLWLAETFSTSSLKPLIGIQRNLTGSKTSTSSTKFVFFGPIGKTRWPPWPLIGWDIFDFFSETAEWNSTKLDRKQDLNVLYQVCVFRADRKNKMAALASDWLKHFRLLLWNRWAEFNETLQEARPQRPLPSLCFSGRSEKQDGRPGLWLAETFSTSSLKPLNGILQNLTGSKISMSSTKFVFFGPIGKTRWPPWPLIGWDIFDFFSETAERNSRKLDRKQDLNVLYQVCVFRADRKNKMAALASDWLRHFRLLWNRWSEFNETWQEARPQRPLQSLCFSGQSEKQDGRPGLWLAETFSTSPLKPLNGIERNLTGSKISMSSTKFVFFGPIKMTALTDSSKRWHIVLRCTICGPLGLLFVKLNLHPVYEKNWFFADTGWFTEEAPNFIEKTPIWKRDERATQRNSENEWRIWISEGLLLLVLVLRVKRLQNFVNVYTECNKRNATV